MARVSLEASSYSTESGLNGKNAAILAIYMLPGANALEVATNVKEAMKEVKRALLEADVNFRVVKSFVKTVTDRAIGQDVLTGLNPGQMVIKIVNEELVSLMGSETTEIALLPGNQVTVIMMIGLQGAGKTTTTAKLAGKFKAKGT